jgi:hypothetical protein
MPPKLHDIELAHSELAKLEFPTQRTDKEASLHPTYPLENDHQTAAQTLRAQTYIA